MLGFILGGLLILSASAEVQMPEELLSTAEEGLHVGIEVEFSNMTLARAGFLLSLAVNGQLEFEQYDDTIHVEDAQGRVQKKVVVRTRAVVRNSDIGKVIIKVEDNNTGLTEQDPTDEPSEEEQRRYILELVTAPIAIHQLQHVQRALDYLRDAGATGTAHGLAVSLQVNVELGQGVADQIDPMVLVEAIRTYSDPEAATRVLEALNPAARRQVYIQEFSSGLLAQVRTGNYRPTKRKLYDDYMYRQMLELMGDSRAWSLPIQTVKNIVLKDLQGKLDSGVELGEPFFRVIKFSRIKIASILISWFPNDPLTKLIVETEWIHPIPAIEYRESDNLFDVIRPARIAVGFRNKAVQNVRSQGCNGFLAAP